MLYPLFAQLVSLLLDLVATRRRSEQQKDLEILLLRQQLRIWQRHHPTAPHLSRWEQFGLAVLAAKCAALGRGAKTKLNQVLLLFKPDIVLKWHRDLVRRKWTFDNRPKRGRPTTGCRTASAAPAAGSRESRLGIQQVAWGIAQAGLPQRPLHR